MSNATSREPQADADVSERYEGDLELDESSGQEWDEEYSDTVEVDGGGEVEVSFDPRLFEEEEDEVDLDLN